MSDFYSIWREQQGKASADQLPLCAIAQEFHNHLQQIIFDPLQPHADDRLKIAQAKYLLQEEWHKWKKSTPARHLANLPEHHQCLDSVYDAAWDSLNLLDLCAQPPIDFFSVPEPVVIEKPVPVPEPTVEIPGTFIGFEDEAAVDP